MMMMMTIIISGSYYGPVNDVIHLNFTIFFLRQQLEEIQEDSQK